MGLKDASWEVFVGITVVGLVILAGSKAISVSIYKQELIRKSAEAAGDPRGKKILDADLKGITLSNFFFDPFGFFDDPKNLEKAKQIFKETDPEKKARAKRRLERHHEEIEQFFNDLEARLDGRAMI